MLLQGKRGLVIGIANDASIAWGCAKAFQAHGAELAAELGAQGIRVNALSPGPIKTRAASGLADFDQLMAVAAERAALHQLVTLEQIGEMAAFLASDHARQVTGQTLYVDAGYNIRG